MRQHRQRVGDSVPDERLVGQDEDVGRHPSEPAPRLAQEAHQLRGRPRGGGREQGHVEVRVLAAEPGGDAQRPAPAQAEAEQGDRPRIGAARQHEAWLEMRGDAASVSIHGSSHARDW